LKFSLSKPNLIKSQAVLALFLWSAPLGLMAQAVAPPTQQATAPSNVVAPGVQYENFVVPAGPRNYNILRVNVADPRVTLETESGQDRLFKGEKVLDSIRRESRQNNEKIVAGINADFWNSKERLYTPVGMLVADGMIYSMPGKRGCFAFTESEQSYIGRLTLTVTLSAGSETLKVQEINPARQNAAKVTLFTPPYGSQVAAGKDGKRFKLRMLEAEFLPNQPLRVEIEPLDISQAAALEAGSLILDVPNDKVQNASVILSKGRKATLSAKIPQVKGVVKSVCGGGPILVRNGKADIREKEEGIGKGFVTARHPRTAIGVSRDNKNVFLVTVDGRQPKISIGDNLYELADFMAKLGCWSALNLDGGGSTTMVVDDKVVNHPSDVGGPRTVAASILVVETNPAGKTPAAAPAPAQNGKSR